MLFISALILESTANTRTKKCEEAKLYHRK